MCLLVSNIGLIGGSFCGTTDARVLHTSFSLSRHNKGMPGTLSPDALLIEKQFPPTASTVKAILAAGFLFKSVAPHGKNDYWFMKPIPADEVGGDRDIILHLVDEANPIGKIMLKLRNACNNDPDAFEEYKVC